MGLERTAAMCGDERGRLMERLWKKIFSRSSGGSRSSLLRLWWWCRVDNAGVGEV